jgi:hypothetical protein
VPGGATSSAMTGGRVGVAGCGGPRLDLLPPVVG